MKPTGGLRPVSQETFCAFCRLLYDRRLVTGVGGNVAARTGNHVFLTPSGVSLRDITPHLLVTVDALGTVRSGEAPTRDIQMHLGILKKRPDVDVICHVHNAHIIAASAMLDPGPDTLPPLTPGFVHYAYPLTMLPFMLPGSQKLAVAAANQLSSPNSNALLLQSHGLITVGHDFPYAVNVAEEIEEAARIFVLTGGRAKSIPREHLQGIRGEEKPPFQPRQRP